jgi:hypothetical protein
MLAVLHALTRRLFHVPFDWARLAYAAGALAAIAVAGELLLPTEGAAGLPCACAGSALVPAAFGLTGFLRASERTAVRGLLRRA